MKKEMNILMKHATIALTPHYEGKISSIVYTSQDTFKSEERVNDILNKYCLQFASTLNGRIEAAREYGFKKNPPIIVSGGMGIVAMQLPFYYYTEKMWVFDLTFGITPVTNCSCEIEFENELKFTIPLSASRVYIRKLKAIELLNDYANNRKRFQNGD